MKNEDEREAELQEREDRLSRLSRELSDRIASTPSPSELAGPTPSKMIRRLSRMAGLFDVSHRTTFQAFRKAKDGRTQAVAILVDDTGPDCEHGLRYSVEARSDDGRVASGNSAATIEAALAMVHWWKLDEASVDPKGLTDAELARRIQELEARTGEPSGGADPG